MKKLVVITGAGISAESGIKTFRDTGGLWEQYDVEDVATYTGWQKNPKLVQEFYNARRAELSNVIPNLAHIILKDLESTYDVKIITTNVDDLHERAGSTNILHLHGSLRQAKGDNPDYAWSGMSASIIEKIYPIEGDEIVHGTLCPEGFILRPHVVWFGESVPEIENAIDIVKEADIVVIVGTSLQVYPAASLLFSRKKDVPVYYVDPHPEEVGLPSDVFVIKDIASIGLQRLVTILENDNNR